MELTAQVGVVTTNPGWYGRAVQRVTGSPAFHTISAISETHCVSAEPPRCVIRPISFFQDVQWTQVEFPSRAYRNDAVRFLRRQRNKPYAYFDIVLLFIAWLLRWKTPRVITARLMDEHQWFCSELADAGMEAGGVNLFPGRPPQAVVPGDFLKVIERQYAGEDSSVPADA